MNCHITKGTQTPHFGNVKLCTACSQQTCEGHLVLISDFIFDKLQIFFEGKQLKEGYICLFCQLAVLRWASNKMLVQRGQQIHRDDYGLKESIQVITAITY